MGTCIARLAVECCGFRIGRHPTQEFDLRPSGPIMTEPLEEMMTHQIQLATQKQLDVGINVEMTEAKPASLFRDNTRDSEYGQAASAEC